MLNQKDSVKIRSKFLIHYKNWIDGKRKTTATTTITITTTGTNNKTTEKTNNAWINVEDYIKRREPEISELKQWSISTDSDKDKFAFCTPAQKRKTVPTGFLNAKSE